MSVSEKAKPLSELSDEELIAEFQQDNEAAFTELVGRYKDPLTNFTYRFLGDWDECCDAVQDTFVRVYRSRHSYKPIAKFSTWLYTIATNLSKSYLRKRKFRSALGLGTRYEDNAERTIDPIDPEPRPDQLADSAIMDERIQQAINTLGMKYREVIILRDIQDLSYEEIATVTGLNIGTVKSRINRARTQLQEKLKDLLTD